MKKLNREEILDKAKRGDDLSGADLSGVDLSNTNLIRATMCGANLSNANLSGAKLYMADLRDATLNGTILRGADMLGANLRGINLIEANLSGSHLIGADLSMANLSGAYLFGADLSRANLSGAYLGWVNLDGAILKQVNFLNARLVSTLFINVDLSLASGLQNCDYGGPSSIDHRTLSKSSQLPMEFLRGCGLSNWEIEAARLYRPGLTPNELIDIQRRVLDTRYGYAVQSHSVFICYSSEDEAVADKVHRSLQNNGVLCWLAKYDTKVGKRIKRSINEAIQIHDRVLLVISKDSIKSRWFASEIEVALARELSEARKVLFPVKIDDVYENDKLDWPGTIHREIRISDFRKWQDPNNYKAAFNKLMKGLRSSDKPKKKLAGIKRLNYQFLEE